MSRPSKTNVTGRDKQVQGPPPVLWILPTGKRLFLKEGETPARR